MKKPSRCIVLLTLAVSGCISATAERRAAPVASTHPRIFSDATILAGPDLEAVTGASILVRSGKIEAIGAESDLVRRAPDATRTSLRGPTVLPGLTDAHAHIDNLGKLLDIVHLKGTRSFDEIGRLVAEKSAQLPKGEWLEGRGWDQNDWPERVFPTAVMLDRYVADRPVLLDRVDGHASLANTAALGLAGISRDTPDPEGGRIVRDAAGNPSGVFLDNARDLVRKVVPFPSHEVQRSRLIRALQVIVSNGLTEVHHAGSDNGTIPDDELISILRELADEGKLPIRVYVMLSDQQKLIDEWFARGPLIGYHDRITVRAIKMYADGALGSRGAALLAPYSDDPGNQGLLTVSPDRIREVAAAAREHGFQVNIHGIGDRAVRTIIDQMEKGGVTPADRFRIEHLQVVALDDLPRIKRLGIIASMQPTHATSDMNWAEKRLGPDRIRGAYAWRKVLNAGIPLALGSDFPVEEVSPLLGIYAAVTRQSVDGAPAGGWYPEEKLTVREAIAGFTSGAAHAAFEEGNRGSIEPGKLADFTVVDRNPLDIPPAELAGIKVRYTIVGGEIVYQAP